MALIQEIGSRLDLNIVETLHYSYRLSCNQLLDMHHTQNELEKNQKTISEKQLEKLILKYKNKSSLVLI